MQKCVPKRKLLKICVWSEGQILHWTAPQTAPLPRSPAEDSSVVYLEVRNEEAYEFWIKELTSIIVVPSVCNTALQNFLACFHLSHFHRFHLVSWFQQMLFVSLSHNVLQVIFACSYHTCALQICSVKGTNYAGKLKPFLKGIYYDCGIGDLRKWHRYGQKSPGWSHVSSGQ